MGEVCLLSEDEHLVQNAAFLLPDPTCAPNLPMGTFQILGVVSKEDVRFLNEVLVAKKAPAEALGWDGRERVQRACDARLGQPCRLTQWRGFSRVQSVQWRVPERRLTQVA